MNYSTLDRDAARLIAAGVGLLSLIAGMTILTSGSAHAASGPMISNVAAVGTSTGTGATVTWTTDVNANGQVVYGTSLPYSATSTLDTAMTTNHSEILTGLTPSTTYHYAVLSTDASSTTAISGDNTFMTMSSPSTGTSTATTTSTGTTTPTTASTTPVTATSTPAVVLSTTSGAPGTLVVVTGSGFTASEPITLVWNGTSTPLAANAAGGFSTTLTVPSSAAIGPLSISATGGTSGAVATSSFEVTSSPIIPPPQTENEMTGTSTDLTALQDELSQLQSQVTDLQGRVSTLENEVAALSAGTTATSTNPLPSTPATIDQNGSNVRENTTIDFSGRNFGHEETVLVTLNRQTVASAHADGGGNFSTGSLVTPATTGTYVYQFTGQVSGRTATASITVTP